MSMRKVRLGTVLFLTVISAVASIEASAQVLEPQRDFAGRVFALKVSGHSPGSVTSPAQIARDFVASNKDVLQISNPDAELQMLEPQTDRIGSKIKFLQTFKGLNVFAGEMSVHMNAAGEINYVKTKLVADLPQDVTPKVSAKAAKMKALALAAGETKLAVKVQESELVVLPVGMIKNAAVNDVRVAYRVEVVDSKSGGDGFSKSYFVDAGDGDVPLVLDGHRELTRQVYDCTGGTGHNTCVLDTPDSVYPSYILGRSEGQPVRGPWPNPNFPLFYGSTDVDFMHDILSNLHNYYSSTFSINGPNGFGGLADWPTVSQNLTRGVVHYDGWAGGACPGYALFSTSTGSIFFCRGMVVTDIVGHEYAHGIVHHSFHDGSGFPIGDTYYGQEGSMNEAYADFMGELYELYATGSTDWINGAQAGYDLRSLADPHSLLRIEFDNLPYPDRFYDATFYCGTGDSGGVHRNLTVPGHAYYLMAQGGEHNGCDIQGQGIDVAQKVAFRGWRSYFSRSAPYAEAYTDLIQACNDLYPANVCAEVTKALQAVEMNQPGRCTATPEAAPACAVKHAGSVSSVRPNLSPATLYAPNEHIWVTGASGMAGFTVALNLTPRVANRAIWSEIVETAQTLATVLPDGTFAASLTQASAVGQFDIVVDGNNDGYYQPWADEVLQIEVKTPIDGDNLCYVGETYDTSENCMQQPIDCGCGSNYSCENIDPSGTPTYQCMWAVQNAGAITGSRPTGYDTDTYAPTENIYVRGEGGVPGTMIHLFLVPHAEGRGSWTNIDSEVLASVNVQPDGTFVAPLTVASELGEFDIIADADCDGMYFQLADSLITVSVEIPVYGDSQCYHGERYATSENCHDHSDDCRCPGSTTCRYLNSSDPGYYCLMPRVKGKLLYNQG